MSVIGIELLPDSLVLTKGRDFKWAFENLDTSDAPVNYPAGQLFFELNTGGEHNAVHKVLVSGATGGTYTLNVNGSNTAAIDYNDVSENPQGLLGDIQDALDGAVGAGKTSVKPVTLYPAWTLTVNLNAGSPLSEQLVNTINKAANDFFDTFDQLFGVDVEMTVTNSLNFKLKVTSQRSFDEVGLATFAVDVTSTAVKNFFNGFSGLIGAVNTVSVDFYWNRSYEIEFIGALGLTAIPATTANAASLTGASKQVLVSVVEPGKSPLTVWPFTISGPLASIKIESPEVDKIAPRTAWQLVFMPTGESAGGDPIARGLVAVQR